MYRLIDNISNKNKHTNKTENVENNDVYIIYRIDTYSWALQHIARRENAPDSASIVYVTFYFWLLLMLRRVNWYCNGKGGYFDSFKDRTQKAKKERFGWPLRGRIRSILLWYIRRLIFHAVFWWIIWCSSKVVDSLVLSTSFFSGLRWNFPSFLLLTYLSKYEWFFFVLKCFF